MRLLKIFSLILINVQIYSTMINKLINNFYIEVKKNAVLLFILFFLFGLYSYIMPGITDPAFLEWTLYIYDHGIGQIYTSRSNNYLPIYHYFLWAYAKLAGSRENIIADLKYLKLFTLFIEFIAVYFVIGFTKIKNERLNYNFYSLIILLNAAYFYNTFFFGQIDGMLTTFIFISFYFAIKQNISLSFIFYAISLSCKFQAILFFPLLILIVFPLILKRGWKKNILSLVLTFLAEIIILFPFILNHNVKSVWGVIANGTVNLLPYLAPSANSMWRWLIPGNQGINYDISIQGQTIKMFDNGFFLGLTYHSWGLLLFIIFSLVALFPLIIRVFKSVFMNTNFIAKEHIPEILLTAALINLCFYFFNTQMHSRYSHYALIFIATYAILKKDYFIYIFFSVTEFLSLEHDIRFFRFNNYDSFVFNAYLITGYYFFIIGILFHKLYKNSGLVFFPNTKYNFSVAIKKSYTPHNFIYLSFSILFFLWAISTYRNVVHMDIITIISSKMKDLLEHNLTAKDFIYQPLFPASISLSFLYFNTLVFHLNTVIETAFGTFFLIILGYKYLNEINTFLSTQKQRILFAFLIGFIIFGLHKWEASFTSFFSFAVFFNLFICFFNYFFVIKYIDTNFYRYKWYHLPLFIFSNLLIIFDAPAYFYAYSLSIIIALIIIKAFKIIVPNSIRWKNILILNTALLIFTIAMTSYLSHHPAFSRYSSNLSLSDFIHVFFQKPVWIIEFYLIATSGAFLGEAYNYTELRALFGFIILIAYGLSIYYVINKKDKRLLVPMAMMCYNIISCGFITISRYIFNDVGYGSSSRYTAFNLLGVVGLVTVLFFYLVDEKRGSYKSVGWLLMISILAGYLFVDMRQLEISPSRTNAFLGMEKALITKTNLEVLQSEKEVSLRAIDVLRKYKLNVYSSQLGIGKINPLYLERLKNTTILASSADFEAIDKTGFYGVENGLRWTDGNAIINVSGDYLANDSLEVILNTFMPSNCKNVTPKLFLKDDKNVIYSAIYSKRTGDKFYFKFHLNQITTIKTINISSELINAAPDARTLSFPFIGLEIAYYGN